MKNQLNKVVFLFYVLVPVDLSSRRSPATGPLMITEEASDKSGVPIAISSQDIYLKAVKIAERFFVEQDAVEKIVRQAQLQERGLGDQIDAFAKSFGQKRGYFQGVINNLERYIEARLAEFTPRISGAKADETLFLTSIIEKITGVSTALATFKTDLEKNAAEYQKIIDLQNQVYQQNQTLNEKQFAFLKVVSQIGKLKSGMNLEENFEKQKQMFSEIEGLQVQAEKVNQEIKTIKNDFSTQIQQGIQAIDVGLQQLEQQLKGIEGNIDLIKKMINDQSTQQEVTVIKSIQELITLKKAGKVKDTQSAAPTERKMFNWIKKYIGDLKSKILRVEEGKVEKLLLQTVQPRPVAGQPVSPLQGSSVGQSVGASAQTSAVAVQPAPVTPQPVQNEASVVVQPNN